MFCNLFILVYLLGAVISSILVVYSFKRREDAILLSFSWLCAAISIWCCASAGEALSVTITGKQAWSVLQYIGSQTAPVFFFLFVVTYTRLDTFLTGRTKLLFFILPVISIILAATNPYHRLLWPDIYLIPGPFSCVTGYFVHGPWFWVEILYSYFLIAGGMLILLISSLKQPPVYGIQTRFILAASIVPVAGNVIYALFPGVLSGADSTPAFFTLTCILIYYAITRFRLFDLIPVMCDEIIQSMGEGILVLDQKKRIVHINPAAMRILSLSGEVTGMLISSVHQKIPVPEMTKEKTGTHQEITLNNGIILSINAYPVFDRDKRTMGTLLIFFDITERVILGQELKTHAENLERVSSQLHIANEKLHLLSGITRHDILNELTILKGYLDLMDWNSDAEPHPEYLAKATHAADNIRDLIRFTKNYEKIGTDTISWLNLHVIVDKGVQRFRDARVDIQNNIPDNCLVFTEPLLETVIGNLIDNALRHGGCVSRISFFLQKGEETCMVICQDDGVGIPADEKEKIFKPGYGKNTGYGLFLTREILAVSDMLITEEGSPGEGAKFVVCIPHRLISCTGSSEQE